MCGEEGSSSVESEDDLITLGEFTEYENAKWRFPKTTRCPVKSCNDEFPTRKLAMQHYKDNHAVHAALCKICNAPIMLKTAAHHFAGHFIRKHPLEPIPQKVKIFRLTCTECKAVFKNYVYLRGHMKNVHKKGTNVNVGTRLKTRAKNEKTPQSERKQTPLAKPIDPRLDAAKGSTKSSSWTDIDTDNSVDADGDDNTNMPPKTNSSTRKVSTGFLRSKKSQDKRNKANPLTQMIKRKARLFQPRQKGRPCTICGMILKNYVIACSHYRKVHGRTVSMCPFCKRYFSKSTALIHHVVINHSQNKEQTRGKVAKPSKPVTSSTANKASNVGTKKNENKDKKEVENEDSQMDDETPATPLNTSVSTSETDFEGFDATATVASHNPIVYLENIHVLGQPNELENATTSENAENSAMSANESAADDFIKIGQLTDYKVMQWQFPDTNDCPRNHCHRQFQTRAEAMEHYIRKHADYDVCCNECGALIALTGAANLVNHYKRRHPTIEPPPKQCENQIGCDICEKSISSAQFRIHMREQHKLDHTGARTSSPSTVDGPPSIRNSSRINKRKALELTEPKVCKRSKRLRKPKPRKMVTSEDSASIDELNTAISVVRISSSVDDEKGNVEPKNDAINESDVVNVTEEVNTIDATNAANSTSSPKKLVSETQKEESKIDQKREAAPAQEATPKVETKQRTRSTGVRNKACTICGQILMNFVIACDHYHRIHGRNVLMCPLCEQYFLQSHLLTKHVLTQHSKDDVRPEPAVNVELIENPSADVINKEQEIRADGADEMPDLERSKEQQVEEKQAEEQSAEEKPVEEKLTEENIAEQQSAEEQPVEQAEVSAEYTTPNNLTGSAIEVDQNSVQNDEPLNLSTRKEDAIDFSNIALDLSMKK